MNNKKLLTKIGWVNELSEEEQEVLKKGHELDEKMRKGEFDKIIKIGILKGIDIKK